MERLATTRMDRLEALLETTSDGFLVIAPTGALEECNGALCALLGRERSQLLSEGFLGLHLGETEASIEQRLQTVRDQGSVLYEAAFRHHGGMPVPVEISISYSPMEGGLFFALVRDISGRLANHELAILRGQLADHALSRDSDKIVHAATDAAVRILASELSVFAFVCSDDHQVRIAAWARQGSGGVTAKVAVGSSYPIGESGHWGECIDKARPIVHNATAAVPRNLLPGVRCAVTQLIIVPILRNEHVVGLLAAINRPSAYVDEDVETMGLIAEETYGFVEHALIEQSIEFLAFRDALTGLPNRKLLEDRLQQAMAHAQRAQKLVAVCYLDLDGFKPVNDRHGHGVGDRLLIAVSHRVKAALRGEDTLARVGGDEFVVLLNDLDSILQCEQAVERLLEVIGQPISVDGLWLWVTASIGVTVYPDDDAKPETLLRHADRAMYRAKEAGKRRYALHDLLHTQKARLARTLKEELEDALREGGLVLEYQPRISLVTGQLAGVEALVRWEHPSRGYLNPTQFLAVAARTPTEFELDKWVSREAVRQHLAWRAQGLEIPVSINLSPYTVQHPGFPEFLAELLSDCPDDVARYLEFEVLETGALHDVHRVSKLMYACIDQGVRFSLDDFGTGYSSLSYFHNLPIDLLKIDQAFVRDMLVDPRDRDIVEGVIRLAEVIGRPVVAEGVESPELGLMLLQLGCQYAQGYSISRPLQPGQLSTWVNNWSGNFYWSRMLKHPHGPTTQYDVNVAILSHRVWVEKLQHHLETEGRLQPPELDETRCQFSQWLGGIGQARFGGNPDMPSITVLHDSIHATARQLASDRDSLAAEEIAERLAGLSRLSDELEHKLITLVSEPTP